MDIVIRLRENADLDAAEHVPDEVVHMQYEAANEIEQLRAQVAHLSLYKPARRTEQKQEPVKVIGPVNEAFWFGLEAAEKDFDSFGTLVKNE